MADWTKSDLVEAMAEESGLPKADCERALQAFVAKVSEALGRGQSVQITGFGTFEVRDRAARKARNPQTGDEIDVAATRVPAFRAGKSLRSVVS